MNNNFTQEELKNISALIQLAPITGKESVTVAQLLIKIGGMLTETLTTEALKEEKKD